MPVTTTPSPSPSSFTSSVPEPQRAQHDTPLPPSRTASPAFSLRQQQPSAPPPPPQGSRRRSTLTSRFPLLRKASREVSTAHSAAPASSHFRGSSTSQPRLPEHPEARVRPPAEPRASISSARGRLARQPDEQPVLRDSSSSRSSRSQTLDPFADSASIHSSTPLQSGPSSRDLTPDFELAPSIQQTAPPKASDRKMHQTSSRLLRMTDDERPFTRVSVYCGNAGDGEPLLTPTAGF